MTRETKIGLLVGLTFIIVVGVLLSDYMTSTREPLPAPLQMAGNELRNGLGQPRSDESSPVAMVPPNVSPRQAVPTREELTPKPKQTSVAVNNQPVSPAGQQQAPVPAALRDVAQRNGEELVDANGHPLTNNNSQPVAKAVADSYTAEPGDSLSKIALKALGANTRANRAAIIALNPSLKENPNMIVVGRVYAIPTAGDAVATNTPAAQQPANQPQTGYVVKPGDTLWSIAVDQLGDAGAISAIKDLNRDVLQDSDRIRPNMKLRLPAKSAASQNNT
jgi:nucleoid-associated protein YgaU